MNRTPTVRRRLAGNDAYTFLMKELEKVDETILEPDRKSTRLNSSH